ncbi:hypothetical protein [Brucella anthropi]|uniref:hypothetical protein n=1 Tax=Brucella anthropi TaxID=529 RepID=UPI003D95BF30
MAARGKPAHYRLAEVCKRLNTTECQLASRLGLSRAALKSIERPDAPLYLQLALTAMMESLQPDPMFVRAAYHSEIPADPVQLRLVR